ncbi:MAG: ATP-binding protein [Thermoleophilia bacterium]|nr:ATP-binding protein [Thermoleophilia bacterium]
MARTRGLASDHGSSLGASSSASRADLRGASRSGGSQAHRPGIEPIPPDLPRIAVYTEPTAAPRILSPDPSLVTEARTLELLDWLSRTAYNAALEQGTRIPPQVFRELVDNLVHADFRRVVITILDGGNTLRISDGGPGIADKEAALRPGFTSADAAAKQFIRGVGSGLSIVQEIVAALMGTLKVEDNLGGGTVITVRVPSGEQVPLAPTSPPSYNLSQRQLKTLLLVMELGPVGPTRIAEELGVSTSTAYRDLVSLEELGLVAAEASGRRSLTDAAMAYLDTVL